MAAMTLLLAHLDSFPTETKNLLAHRYHSDRAMYERVQENMEEVNRINSDALSAQSADLLHRLLAIEVEMVDDNPASARRVSVQAAGLNTAIQDPVDGAVVSVHIPYFGIIKIAREGLTKEIPEPRTIGGYRSASANFPVEPELDFSRSAKCRKLINPDIISSTDSTSHNATTSLSPSQGLSEVYAINHSQIGSLPTDIDEITTHLAPQHPFSVSSPLWYDGEYPELAAAGDNWAFQGVDMAFFDSLMRSDVNGG